MTWKSIDFQGIVNLSESLVDQLYRYLEEKETAAGLKILHSIHPFLHEAQYPYLTPEPSSKFQISEAVEGLSKKIRLLAQLKNKIDSVKDWQPTAKTISVAIWDYLETLQESVTELFQQIDQVEIEQWKQELARVVDLIKELLMHHLDDLHWAVLRLENLVKEYRLLCESQEGRWMALRKIVLMWDKILDRSLLGSIEKTKKYLGFRYQNFSDRYERYQVMQSKITSFIDKYKNYKVFDSLEPEYQDKIIHMYRLIKFWELNSKEKSLPQREFIRSIRHLIHPEKALELYRHYFNLIKGKFFFLSRELKNSLILSQEKWNSILEFLTSYQHELHTLGATAAKYREFLLKTDPNPYVRSRLGFPDWFAGPEPSAAKQLSNFTYDVESLDVMMNELKKSFEVANAVSDADVEVVKRETTQLLHEMGQPLISKDVMKARCESLVKFLVNLNELGTTRADIVEFNGEALARALRYDWKYHALFDIPAFHHLYAIHIGIVGQADERSHLNRLHKFRRLIQQIGQWIKSNDTPRHTHEIEADMNDIKVYLQDFLAHVQRVCMHGREDKQAVSMIEESERQLLEYRYLFGNFFHALRDTRPEERMIRNQFLFVDQYFEAIETKIHDWKASHLNP